MWAVGFAGTADIANTLIEHWDGKAWHIVPSPNGDSDSNSIVDISAVNSNDVWAVGSWYADYVPHILIEHWDGNVWTRVASPADLDDAALSAVTAVSANDVWAVGGYGTGRDTPRRPLILHWDGTSWSRVPVLEPNPPYGALFGITVLAPDNIWATGGYRNSPPPTLNHTLTLHYDGTTWNKVSSPSESPGSHDNYLLSVSAISKDDIWAVGSSYLPKPPIIYPLIEHWDGSEWTIVSSPFQYLAGAQTRAVATALTGEAWAVGTYRSALIGYWNGNEWKDTSPNNGDGFFYDVATVGSDTLWAVGQLPTSVNENQTFILRGHRHCRKLALCANAPIPLSPAQNAVIDSHMARLDWKNQKCATYYQVQVKRDTSQGELVKRQRKDRISEYIFSRTTPDWGNQFVWHVRACNNRGCSNWSEWRKFSLQT